MAFGDDGGGGRRGGGGFVSPFSSRQKSRPGTMTTFASSSSSSSSSSPSKRFEVDENQPPRIPSATEKKKKTEEKKYAYWKCLFAKRKTNAVKRKTLKFEDGALRVDVNTNESILYNEKCEKKAKGKPGTIVEGTECSLQEYEIEIDCEMKEDEFASGMAFAHIDDGKERGGEQKKPRTTFTSGFRPVVLHAPSMTTSVKTAPTKVTSNMIEPIHSVNAPNAVVLYDGSKPNTIGPIPIVLDPSIARFIRPHQKRGIEFMLKSCLNITSETRSGCLLSHDVGLGKTLQVIALIWTLLRQSPRPSQDVRRDIRFSITKAIIAVPATLVGNWKNEFKKWLDLKLEVEAVDGSNTSDAKKKQLLKEWALDNQKRRLVLICSYETLRTNAHLLENKAQLLVCDEAHRLKAKDGSKTLDGLKKLNCKMRILLSGTAVQNNLAEFYSLMDFANPGVLNDYPTFRKVYQIPAERANDSKATDEEKMIGKARANAIFEKTAIFIDRCAKADVKIDGLPPKTEYCLFLSLTEAQWKSYKAVCDLVNMKRVDNPLVACGVLQKVCNGIGMLSSSASSSSNELQLAIQEANKVTTTTNPFETSVKLRVLRRIVVTSQKLNERVVVVSGWTSTLDVIEKALTTASPGLRFTRLDGTTPSHKRTQLVTSFNNGLGGSVFLLSRKAGGVGLNLIGANRLVLFDCDWNPANDLQATARIHRDGQTKNTFIYRLLTSFTLEEKIFQRQCQKGALARSMGFACVENTNGDDDDDDSDNDPKTFSSDELRKLFIFEYTYKTTRNEPCEMAKVESCQSWMKDCRGKLDDDVLKQMDEEATENDVRFYAKLS